MSFLFPNNINEFSDFLSYIVTIYCCRNCNRPISSIFNNAPAFFFVYFADSNYGNFYRTLHFFYSGRPYSFSCVFCLFRKYFSGSPFFDFHHAPYFFIGQIEHFVIEVNLKTSRVLSTFQLQVLLQPQNRPERLWRHHNNPDWPKQTNRLLTQPCTRSRQLSPSAHARSLQ